MWPRVRDIESGVIEPCQTRHRSTPCRNGVQAGHPLGKHDEVIRAPASPGGRPSGIRDRNLLCLGRVVDRLHVADESIATPRNGLDERCLRRSRQSFLGWWSSTNGPNRTGDFSLSGLRPVDRSRFPEFFTAFLRTFGGVYTYN